jgi:hypothetical protein
MGNPFAQSMALLFWEKCHARFPLETAVVANDHMVPDGRMRVLEVVDTDETSLPLGAGRQAA